ncbi:hypothetical protein BaRGS_00000686, partial [Batillaria attramentaria]
PRFPARHLSTGETQSLEDSPFAAPHTAKRSSGKSRPESAHSFPNLQKPVTCVHWFDCSADSVHGCWCEAVFGVFSLLHINEEHTAPVQTFSSVSAPNRAECKNGDRWDRCMPVFCMNNTLPAFDKKPFSMAEICAALEKATGYCTIERAQRI